MTIDEARRHLDTWSTTHGSGITTDEQHEQAKKIARDIMRKYQKIEQILDDWENSGEEDDPINIIDSIEEVVEDGENT